MKEKKVKKEPQKYASIKIRPDLLPKVKAYAATVKKSVKDLTEDALEREMEF